MALALDEPTPGDIAFESEGIPFLIARHDAARLGAVRIDWLGFPLARPVACRSSS